MIGANGYLDGDIGTALLIRYFDWIFMEAVMFFGRVRSARKTGKKTVCFFQRSTSSSDFSGLKGGEMQSYPQAKRAFLCVKYVLSKCYGFFLPCKHLIFSLNFRGGVCEISKLCV